jgi:molybdopterin-guanine dinucleotide biosynthesis protein MobB
MLPRLSEQGLRVGVIKHDAHSLDFDRPGKDTHRYREAGCARVEAFDSRWWFQVAPVRAPAWEHLPEAWRQDVDVLLVEGGRGGPMDKIWIAGPDGEGAPEGTSRVIAVVRRHDGALRRVEELILAWLASRWSARPRGVVVIGDPGAGKGTLACARAFAPRFVLDGPPGVPGVQGPAGSVLAAMRWGPGLSWLVLSPDLDRMSTAFLEWLWSLRRPGLWAVIPRDPSGTPRALAAVYEPQAAHVLEQAAAGSAPEPLRILDDHPNVLVVDPPASLAGCLVGRDA